MGIQHKSVKDMLVKNGFDYLDEVVVKETTPKGGRPAKAFLMTDEVLTRVMSQSRVLTKDKAKKLSEVSGVNLMAICQIGMSRVESEFLASVNELCSIIDVDVTPQFSCLGFNIDIAIECAKSILLIECDEIGHSNSSAREQDKYREKKITEELLNNYTCVSWFRFDFREYALSVARLANLIHSDSALTTCLTCKIGGYEVDGFRTYWNE
jgi:antitoxin component HigA of HigAB toxin-antitoxin module